ncbi:hypothetical protein [Litchfieldia salsa]|uniref:Uncharacterized protein n=1 Tax=Litchfieldia salsa TaxID=930152 RepID=A0A1H0PSU6_9BACI|nr:hypothetical protein [Litchfieldia salsa]SDP08221.1 hypothetical protein SAMN05216565_101455 [Litchfieldia salsa]
MTSTKHKIFNLLLVFIPWLTVLFIGKKSLKRYSLSSIIIGIYEILSHVQGRKKKYWKFYDKPKNFLRDELPFDIGPYVPASMWILKYTYGNFKKFVLVNGIFDAIFAFLFIPFLEKIKILRLHRLNYLQFFFYIHYKAYLLYGVQYIVEKVKGSNSLDKRFGS